MLRLYGGRVIRTSSFAFPGVSALLGRDQRLTLINNGGEVHSFTEVAHFGAGFVPELNAALPPGTPPAQPVGDLNFMAAGETLELDPLPAGTHRFECLIHPWMRTVAVPR